MTRLRVIDLFAGCGGLSLGFKNIAFRVVAAFDNWRAAINVYKKNFSHPIIDIDLSQTTDYTIFKKYIPDIIIGSPPCQDFSSAGKRNENLGRANLTISYVEIVINVKPKWFVMENVERIVKSKTLQSAFSILKKAGYGLTEKILDASLCGVPQLRKRYFLIGKLNGPDDILLHYLNKNLSAKRMTVDDYLGDDIEVEFYYRHPRSYQRRAVFSIHEPSPTIRGVNRPIPKGYKKHRGDAAEISQNVRVLTTLERSYIQTFPKNFKFTGNKTEQEQMIGNAVPVKLAEYVAKCILEYISDNNKNRQKRTTSIQKKLEFQYNG